MSGSESPAPRNSKQHSLFDGFNVGLDIRHKVTSIKVSAKCCFFPTALNPACTHPAASRCHKSWVVSAMPNPSFCWPACSLTSLAVDRCLEPPADQCRFHSWLLAWFLHCQLPPTRCESILNWHPTLCLLTPNGPPKWQPWDWMLTVSGVDNWFGMDFCKLHSTVLLLRVFVSLWK